MDFDNFDRAIETTKSTAPNDDSLKGMENPYGEGGASEKIIEKLKTVFLDESLIKKRFYEISQWNVMFLSVL